MIKQVTYYDIICDRCGKSFSEESSTCYPDTESAEMTAMYSEWRAMGGGKALLPRLLRVGRGNGRIQTKERRFNLKFTIMNENIDLTKILRDCPKGTKLYSPIFGEVEFYKINNNNPFYQIIVIDKKEMNIEFTATGRFYDSYNDAECLLFPSKENRDWSTFKPNKPKFDPKTLKPFEKVLGRDANDSEWLALLFSHINDKGRLKSVGYTWKQIIPYNDDTKHLLGTRKEAPEYYRYWKD